MIDCSPSEEYRYTLQKKEARNEDGGREKISGW
jgi:hypothetical protein